MLIVAVYLFGWGLANPTIPLWADSLLTSFVAISFGLTVYACLMAQHERLKRRCLLEDMITATHCQACPICQDMARNWLAQAYTAL